MGYDALCFPFSFPTAAFLFFYFFNHYSRAGLTYGEAPDGIIDMIKVPIMGTRHFNLQVFAKSESFRLLSSRGHSVSDRALQMYRVLPKNGEREVVVALFNG